MKLPKQVKVGGLTYKVSLNDEVRLADESALGRTAHLDQEISVTTRYHPEQIASTFFHELLHCATRHAGLSRDWEEAEENYVARLETSLMMIFTDNPDVLKILLEHALRSRLKK